MIDILSYFREKVVVFWRSILWVIIMLVLFLLPANNLSNAPSAPFLSETVHIIMFAVLACLLLRELSKKNPGRIPSKKNYMRTIILSLLFGIFIEILQEVSNLGRTAEIKDVLFDLIGVLLSTGILLLFSRSRAKKSSETDL